MLKLYFIVAFDDIKCDDSIMIDLKSSMFYFKILTHN